MSTPGAVSNQEKCCILGTLREGISKMAMKPNYQFEKRQRELEKKKKKAEKAQKKQAPNNNTNPSDDPAQNN